MSESECILTHYGPQGEPVLAMSEFIYYVDATGGNDANGGRTPETPWQTMGKVNGYSFLPGDQILFKRDETWTGTMLNIPSSGTAARSITFGAYGTGVKPIIDGNNVVDCINGANCRYLRFKDIAITRGLDFGFIFNGSTTHHIDLVDCEASACGNDNVIIITDAHHFTISGLVSYDAYQRIPARVSCLEIADGAHDIVVTDSEFYGSEEAGIAIHSHPIAEFPYNITISDCSCRDNGEMGIIITQDNPAAILPADCQINISDCQFNGAGIWAGISITQTGDPYPGGITFDQCETFGSAGYGIYCGGQATFTRCASRGTWTALRLDGASDCVVNNCTLYRAAGEVLQVVNATDGLTMRNCIINRGTAGTIVNINAGSLNIDIDYTLYESDDGDPVAGVYYFWLGAGHNWANWLINSGQDANSPAPADPLFTDPAADDFTLQAGSPAIDAGVDVGLPYCDTAPDCGAYEVCP